MFPSRAWGGGGASPTILVLSFVAPPQEEQYCRPLTAPLVYPGECLSVSYQQDVPDHLQAAAQLEPWHAAECSPLPSLWLYMHPLGRMGSYGADWGPPKRWHLHAIS